MKTTKRTAWMCGVMLACAMTGCGGRGDRPELGTVRGKVTLDGKPLDLARVTFEPTKGRPSNGLTNAEGEYELDYLTDVKGAVIGGHVVRISTNDLHEDPATGKRVMIPERVPQDYNVQTILKADVADGDNVVAFDLKSKPR